MTPGRDPAPRPLSEPALESTIARRALGGFYWASWGAGARAVLKMIVLAVLARLLTPQDFGIVAAASLVVRFSDIFSQLGVGQALIQRKELETRHIDTAFTASVVSGVALAGLIWAIAPLLSDFFRMEALTRVVRGLSLLFPISGASVVAQCMLQRRLRFRAIAKADIASYAVGYCALGVALAWAGFGLWALVGALIGQSLLKSTLLLTMKSQAARFRFERQAWRELLYYGGGHTAARVSNYFALQGDYLVVGRWLGAAALGLYGRAYDLMALPATLLGNLLDSVLFPTMARLQDDPDRLATAYRRGIALTALAVLPLSGVIIVLAPELIAVFLGPQWRAAILPFQILTIGMYFRSGYKLGASVGRATGAVYQVAWRQMVYAALVVVGAVLGQNWNLSGVAVGVLFSLFGIFLMNAQLGKSLTSLSWRGFWKVHLPAGFLTAVVVVESWSAVTAMRTWHLPEAVIIFVVVALVTMTALVLLRICPHRVLGSDGVWMLETVSASLPQRLRFKDPVNRVANGPARAQP